MADSFWSTLWGFGYRKIRRPSLCSLTHKSAPWHGFETQHCSEGLSTTCRGKHLFYLHKTYLNHILYLVCTLVILGQILEPTSQTGVPFQPIKLLLAQWVLMPSETVYCIHCSQLQGVPFILWSHYVLGNGAPSWYGGFGRGPPQLLQQRKSPTCEWILFWEYAHKLSLFISSKS